MKNKHPQYLTAKGLIRQKRRPTPLQERKKKVEEKKEDVNPEITLSTSIAKRVLRKRKVSRNFKNEERQISPAAAKAIAEAIKGLLHS